MMPALMLVMNSISLLIVWVGSKGVDAGTIQVGNIMAFIQYTMQIVISFLFISMLYNLSSIAIGLAILGISLAVLKVKNDRSLN